MPGPVAIQCNGCRRFLGTAGDCREFPETIAEEKQIASFENSRRAFEAATGAGWKVDWPAEPDGNSFQDDSDARCPDCAEDPLFWMKRRRAELAKIGGSK